MCTVHLMVIAELVLGVGEFVFALEAKFLENISVETKIHQTADLFDNFDKKKKQFDSDTDSNLTHFFLLYSS